MAEGKLSSPSSSAASRRRKVTVVHHGMTVCGGGGGGVGGPGNAATTNANSSIDIMKNRRFSAPCKVRFHLYNFHATHGNNR